MEGMMGTCYRNNSVADFVAFDWSAFDYLISFFFPAIRMNDW
jgi:hypothetical protein